MGIQDKLRGLGVAVATPFEADGRVDLDAFESLLDFLAGVPRAGNDADATGARPSRSAGAIDGPGPAGFRARESGGCDFIVVLGSTGEAATIEDGERAEIVSRAVGRHPGLPIVVGTGSNSTAHSVRMTEEAVRLGADAVLVVTPYYNKPTPDGLAAHYAAVAEAASGRSVVVYNVPGRTGLNLAPQTLSRLWGIPGVDAVKESSGNLAQIGEMYRTLPAGKVLLSGDDALALPAIALGASGLISVSGNLLPRRHKSMIAAALSGRRDEAVRMHRELLPLMDALFLESNPGPLKSALEIAGLCGSALRLPLAPAQASTRAKLAECLAPYLEGRA